VLKLVPDVGGIEIAYYPVFVHCFVNNEAVNVIVFKFVIEFTPEPKLLFRCLAQQEIEREPFLEDGPEIISAPVLAVYIRKVLHFHIIHRLQDDLVIVEQTAHLQTAMYLRILLQQLLQILIINAECVDLLDGNVNEI
tara:strand:+ start:256 stop:669 length:414 start_codon:yes stop_codon:yes gene_type:complete